MFNVIALVLCVISSLFLIVFILLHSGKGSGLSDMFGGVEPVGRHRSSDASTRSPWSRP